MHKKLASVAIACLGALTLSSEAKAEGLVELTNGNNITQSLRAGAVLYVDILDAGEGIKFYGNGTATIYNSSATQIAALTINQETAALPADTYMIVLDTQQSRSGWDISVTSQVTPGGRLFSYNWEFNLGSFGADRSTYSSFYAIVPGGISGDVVIELKLDGLSGYVYDLAANRVGVDGINGGRSVEQGSTTVTPEFPMYLNPPSVANYEVVNPTGTAFEYQGTDQPATAPGGDVSQCDMLEPGRQTGSFVFTSNAEGTYNIICDIDGDGSYERSGSDDLLLIGTANIGSNDVPWDGTLNSGATVASGTFNCQLQVNVGEFHYVATDIETSYEGMRMYEYESGGTRQALSMFWDDTLRQGFAQNMPNGEVGLETSADTGMDSGDYATAADANVNARAWGNFNSGGKGNRSYLDTYAFARSSATTVVNLTVSDGLLDSDNDGLTDFEEKCIVGTDPNDEDTDDDNTNDGEQYGAADVAGEAVIFFEDMIGAGQNDWDYNDFIVKSNVLAQADGANTGLETITVTYTPMARGAGYFHELKQKIPTVGGWSATITVGGTETASFSGSGEFDYTIADTRDLMPLNGITGSYSNTDDGQGAYAAGNTAVLTITLNSPSLNPRSIASLHPFDVYLDVLYAPVANTEIHLSDYSGQVEELGVIGTTLNGLPNDADSITLPFAVAISTTDTLYWPCEGRPAWHHFSNFIDWARGGIGAPGEKQVFTQPNDTAEVWTIDTAAVCP